MCCNRSYQRKFDKNLKERFFNTYIVSNHINNKFIFLLGKGICTYEYMDDWEKFNERSLSEKEDFYCHLNMKGIADADHAREKRACEDSEIKNLGEYHDLYVQVIHYCQLMYLRTYEICVLYKT